MWLSNTEALEMSPSRPALPGARDVRWEHLYGSKPLEGDPKVTPASSPADRKGGDNEAGSKSSGKQKRQEERAMFYTPIGWWVLGHLGSMLFGEIYH